MVEFSIAADTLALLNADMQSPVEGKFSFQPIDEADDTGVKRICLPYKAQFRIGLACLRRCRVKLYFSDAWASIFSMTIAFEPPR